jgi:putative hydrolase of the HAD superfamily
MNVRGIIFDINGTLIDIQTNEEDHEVYRTISNLLSYQGILLSPGKVKDLYYRILHDQRRSRNEHHPEFDAVGIFREIIGRCATGYTRRLPAEKIAQLPLFLAEAYRAASRRRLKLYRGVQEVLGELRNRYHLAAVSDGQHAYAYQELHAVGLLDYFDPIVVSGELGYRKPDRRLYGRALSRMNLSPWEVLFVGDSLYRDIYGAKRMGIKTVWFKNRENGDERRKAEPDYIIYDFRELLNAVRFFN